MSSRVAHQILHDLLNQHLIELKLRLMHDLCSALAIVEGDADDGGVLGAGDALVGLVAGRAAGVRDQPRQHDDARLDVRQTRGRGARHHLLLQSAHLAARRPESSDLGHGRPPKADAGFPESKVERAITVCRQRRRRSGSHLIQDVHDLSACVRQAQHPCAAASGGFFNDISL